MRPPTALTIAGSDSSGGAGIQADLKTFTALGVYGASVLTSITAQNTQGVRSIHEVPASSVTDQIRAVVEDLTLDATKIGMLGTPEVAAAVADALLETPRGFGRVVLDPVMVATSGDQLVPDETVRVIRDRLIPLAHVLTPNLPEAATLLGGPVATDPQSMREQAIALRDLGADVVVLKGGHLTSGDQVVDIVVHPGGTDVLRGERVPGRNTHGTGCTFSSAIAAQYARIAEFSRTGDLGEIGEPGSQDDDFTVIASAREFLASALAHAVDWQLSRHPESGHGPVNHLITLDNPDRR